MSNVFVLGLATHPPAARLAHLRLEEIAYYTAKAALADAGVTRRQLDSVTLASSDELDGRPISSMLMSAAAGGYETDEIKIADSGASAMCMAYARFLSGESELGLVSSWCKSSKTDVDAISRFGADPFFYRPLGIDRLVTDAVLAQCLSEEFAIDANEVAARVRNGYLRGARNPRGMRHEVPSLEHIQASPYESTPLRRLHRAPLTDGAVSLVLASADYVRARGIRPLAELTGIGWATDAYQMGAARLRRMDSARKAADMALKAAGLKSFDDLDVVELECQTGFHEAALVRALGIDKEEALCPSGGVYAQNPLFCTGLVNAAEAVLQVCGRAGPVQRPNVRRAAAHGCHGFAQQGNTVMVFQSVEAMQ
ncbi:thiolase family protein [Variovorax sp. PBL-E5]|uniref:thiolase family protein n=1 Tax=Variovorax sp. PBL-E5 TaxID=434014 RepID=UPI001316FC2C|nr:thiolase family protein [Variovorax sp. PBL-E5]VTU39239.1 lipid-transfer protein [Variovorax sp. PBL-E5]